MRRILIVACCVVLTGCGESPEDLVAELRTRDRGELQRVTDRLLRHHEDVVPALRAGLMSDDWRTRFMCAQLLGTVRSQQGLPDLVEALQDTVPGVVERAAYALGLIGDGAATPHLVRALDHSSIDVAISAAKALQQIEAPDAMPALLRHAHSPSPRLRQQVLQAFSTCVDTQQAVADTIYDRLVQSLRAPTNDERIAAIAGLGGFGYRSLAPWLLAASTTPPDEIAYVAVQALGEIDGDDHPGWWGVAGGEATIVDTLLSVVHHAERQEIRAKAVQSLGQLKAERAVPLLDSLYAGPRGTLRTAAGRALREIAGEGW